MKKQKLLVKFRDKNIILLFFFLSETAYRLLFFFLNILFYNFADLGFLKMLLLFVSVWMGYRLINGMDFIIFEFHVSFFVLLFWIFSNPMSKI